MEHRHYRCRPAHVEMVRALWQPVASSVLALAVVAAIWSRAMRGTVRYPL
jgi:hypothetical protein